MAVSRKHNVKLPQFLHQFKAGALPFSVRFQHRRQPL